MKISFWHDLNMLSGPCLMSAGQVGCDPEPEWQTPLLIASCLCFKEDMRKERGSKIALSWCSDKNPLEKNDNNEILKCAVDSDPYLVS